MDSQHYYWNKTLKFSWGHIIAFTALIFVSYVTYMGDFYANGGNFKSAAIKVFITDVTFLIIFIGAQLLKGTDSKFDRSIILERLLIIISPFVFIVGMIPYNHFWNVFAERNNIESLFTTSIENSKNIFFEYDAYVEQRVNKYETHLDQLIANKVKRIKGASHKGYSDPYDQIAKENYLHTLKLQLNSQNTDSLKTLAMSWIESANQGASVWNAFLVGNVDKISYAIDNWYKSLATVSKKKMSNENTDVQSFDKDSQAFSEAIQGLNQLKSLYKAPSGLSLVSLLTGFILYVMFMFPYILQKRNSRANGLYFLVPHSMKENKENKQINEHKKEQPNYQDKNHSVEDKEEIPDEDIYSGTF